MKATSEIILSFKPNILQYWLRLFVLAFSILLAFGLFGIKSITGICISSISIPLTIYILIVVFTTKCIITHNGVLIKNNPFSGTPKEINYADINNISVKQGVIQKLLRIGNLSIKTEQFSKSLKGIKNPHKIKELINNEKTSYVEKRILLRKIL